MVQSNPVTSYAILAHLAFFTGLVNDNSETNENQLSGDIEESGSLSDIRCLYFSKNRMTRSNTRKLITV